MIYISKRTPILFYSKTFIAPHSSSLNYTSLHLLIILFFPFNFLPIQFTSLSFGLNFLPLQFTSQHYTSPHLTSFHFTALLHPPVRRFMCRSLQHCSLHCCLKLNVTVIGVATCSGVHGLTLKVKKKKKNTMN
jgi:hypothetical protein